MKAFFKRNLHWIFFSGCGALNFVLLAIPYIAIDLNWIFVPINGYSITYLLAALDFSSITSAIIQILILIVGTALLALGVFGFLKEYNVLPKIPDKIGNLELKKLGVILLCGYAALNALLLIFLIITCVSINGLMLSAGIFITLVFSIAACIGLITLDKKLAQPPPDSPEPIETADTDEEV